MSDTMNPKPQPHTFALAQEREKQTGRPQYVVQNGDLFVIQERMPMLGVWYTADGIRHG